MVISAALLIRERGAHATAISDVLAHSAAPRGSAYHHFPGGRTQLLCEAIDYAGEHVAAMINTQADSCTLLDALVGWYRKQLLDTDFRAGCPVVAVTVEAGEPQDRDRMAPVVARAAIVFDRWTELISAKLATDGVSRTAADELAMLLISAIEGAIVVARASRDLAPLDAVARRLRAVLSAELPNSPDERTSDDR